ncbi:hypothetical protein KSF_081260 [Reticulibacter mediterranei]|uniref:Uncharacterized protein n=1 Tax=Reticulibacter mediterranei TaxID=2778369 RepID=A0A8J3N6Z4_9CHLR|nr:hypothetical protein [Reticulibacter mediterranei]GHO98078.1 hypothetical protein KSF_081260 [Reticulibacter mediterranei]
MDDLISRNTELEEEIMRRQNGIIPSYSGSAPEILRRTDPSRTQIVQQIFGSPGNGPEILFQMLRFAEVKQMALPGMEGQTDVAVVSLQNLRELAKKIHYGYDTTHKYVIVFCALNLLVKVRQEGRIQLLFPLQHYAPPPTTQALDKLIKYSRPKVRQFATRVKQRCILYGIISENGSQHKEYSTGEQQLLRQLYDIIQDEKIEPAKRQRLFKRISSEIICDLFDPSNSSGVVAIEAIPAIEQKKVVPEALPQPARSLALPEKAHTDEPITAQPDVVTSNRPPASGKNPFAIKSIATMGIVQEAKKLIEENNRLLAEDPFAQPAQEASQMVTESNKPAIQEGTGGEPSVPSPAINASQAPKHKIYKSATDDDSDLTKQQQKTNQFFQEYLNKLYDPNFFEKVKKLEEKKSKPERPEVDPRLAAVAARHGLKIVNDEVIHIDESGNEIPKPPKKKVEPETSSTSDQPANAKITTEKSTAGKKSPSSTRKAELPVPPASKKVKTAPPAIEKSPVEKKSPPPQTAVQDDTAESKQAVAEASETEKSTGQSTEDGFSEISMIDPKHYSQQFLTTYVTYNVIDFINILYNNNVNNDRTLRKQLAMFLAELFDGDLGKWKIHMKLINDCSAEAVTGSLVYVFSRLYDQGGHTITNKAGLFTTRCREYHAEGLDAGVISLVKTFQDKTFEQLITFFKQQRQKQLDQQDKFKAENRQTYQQQNQRPPEQPGATNRSSIFAMETPKDSNAIMVRQGNKVVVKRYNYGRIVTGKRRRTNEIIETQRDEQTNQ